MKQITGLAATLLMTTILTTGCGDRNTADTTADGFQWQIDRFDDINVLRYQVPDFDSLTPRQKQFIYYLSQAAVSGRDILFDQNCKYNLPVRRTLEAIYTTYDGDKNSADWQAFEKYLKKVWFANGVHHHYSGDKFKPEFSAEYFESLLASTPAEKLGDIRGTLLDTVKQVIFDPALYPKRVDQTAGVDMIAASACNYYDGVTQKEAEAFYTALTDTTDRQPISYGLNSQLVKDKDGQIAERVWSAEGMYGPAIREIVKWLELAAAVADTPQQEAYTRTLIEYYKTGDLKLFDRYNVAWVEDTESTVDYVNGFIENYGDPLGYKASWESTVNFKDFEATKTTQIISDNAQWFEDHSPIDPQYRKPHVKGVSAKVITVAMLGGDCYPSTPIGINLPNADWIRRDHGSKSVTIANITAAYDAAAAGNGFAEEFILRPEDRQLRAQWGTVGNNLHTDLHECLGHASGQLAPGTKGDELKNYGSTLEEARADLFALYYMNDPKLVELGIIPTLDVAKAEYNNYMMNGLMTQLTRIEPGKNIEEAHMRNRALVAGWVYERGKDDKTVEFVTENGKTYVVVNDYDKLRGLFGELLKEIQRIKSEGDFKAGMELVENYGVKVDPTLHKEVLERYAALDIAPYSGFVNPRYVPVLDENGKITDVKIEYPTDYIQQMLTYSSDYSFLPNRN
ncbi:dipeptidyl-peptidase 3 family protein [Rikenella microfusus]|uniref:Peptidase family M49 n=1 Tax=Rikenella microfusus TaxID=28139 RepID=A0A379MU81_9BACT|nr:Peptidase family M49 [Rikenella microfusus]